MALLWIEGFEGFGSTLGGTPAPTGIMGRKYPIILGESTINIQLGRGDVGYCVEQADISYYFQSPAINADATTVLGLAIRIGSLPSGLRQMLGLYDGVTPGIRLYLDTDGKIKVYRGASTLLGSTVLSLSSATWHYIEWKVFLHDTTGTVHINVDGVEWLALTSQDTKEGALTAYPAFRIGNPQIWSRFDDLYFLDGTGGVNDDILGPRQVVAIYPDADGATSDWTYSEGATNFGVVDEGALLDETDYVSTSTDGDQDLYSYEALPGGITSVDGLQVTTEIEVTSGTMDFSTYIKSSTSYDTSDPGSFSVGSPQTVSYVTAIDPATSSAWTSSGINAAEFGIKANT